MNRFTYAAALAALALAGFAVVGCDRDNTTASKTRSTSSTTSTAPAVDVDVNVNKSKLRDMADRTGDAIKTGAEKTGDALSTAAEKTKEGAKNVGEKVSEAAQKTGDAAKNVVDRARQAGSRGTANAPDAEDIRDVLAQVTEAALTKNGAKDMVERFVDADRSRLGQGDLKNSAELDGRIDQFRKDWKAHFGKDFNIKNEEAALPEGLYTITQSEIPKGEADTNRNAGRNIATIQVAAGHDLPDLTVTMIHESLDRWKLDVPESLTADKLKQNVLDHLTMADDPSKWPTDVNDGYAMVSHHVLMAVMDKPAK